MIDDNVDRESHLVAEVATKRTNSFPRLRERITLKNSSESGEDFACIFTIFCVCEKTIALRTPFMQANRFLNRCVHKASQLWPGPKTTLPHCDHIRFIEFE